MNLTGQAIHQKGVKPAKNTAVRQDARDRECTLNIAGVCCHDPSRVVGLHLRLFGFAGMGQKPDDVFILDGCDCCHAILDSRDKWAEALLGWDDILLALMKTIRNRRAAGLILLKGEPQ